MSKYCPNCGFELDDAAVVCSECGKELIAEEQPEAPVTELMDEAVTETPAAELIDAPEAPAETAEESVSEAAEETAEEPVSEAAEETAEELITEAAGETAEEPVSEANAPEEYVSPINFGVPRPTPEIGVPEQAKPEKKSKKELALGIGLVVCIVLLIASIVTAAIIITSVIADKATGAGEKKESMEEMQKTLDAYLDSDYETYYSHDYYIMFKQGNLDEVVKQAEEYDEMLAASKEGVSAKVLDEVRLPDDAIDSIKKHLESEGYNDVDEVEDIRLAIVQINSPSQQTVVEEADAKDADEEVSVSSIYIIKVDGDWYYSSGF